MTHCGMSWQDLQDTPPRILWALLDYLGQRRAFAPKPAASPFDTPMSPSEFRSMVEGNRGY